MSSGFVFGRIVYNIDMDKNNKFIAEIENYANQEKLYSVVFYGASTTSAEYAMPNWGEIIRYWLKDYVAEKLGDYKKSFWNIQTSNRGLNGASSQELLERFAKLVLSLNPQLIFLSVGKNDAYYGIDKEITRKNTGKIIKTALDKNIKIVFATTVPTLWEKLNDKIRPYVEIDREVAKNFEADENFIFVDFYKFFSDDDLNKAYTLVSEDGNEDVGIAPGEVDPIHYNRIGNAKVAKILLKEAFGIDFNDEKFLEGLEDISKKYPGH